MNGNNHHFIRWEKVTQVSIADEVETHALAGVDTSPEKAKYAAFAGPSGCSKSRLLSIPGSVDSPTAGDCRLDGPK